MLISRLQIQKTTQASSWSNSRCNPPKRSPNAISTKTPFSNPKKAVGMKLRALRNHRIRILEGRICKSPANPIEINSQNHLFQSRKTPEGGGNNGPRPVRGPTPVCLSGNSVLRQKIVSNRVQAVCFQRLLSFHTRKLPKNRHFLPLFSTPKTRVFHSQRALGFESSLLISWQDGSRLTL